MLVLVWFAIGIFFAVSATGSADTELTWSSIYCLDYQMAALNGWLGEVLPAGVTHRMMPWSQNPMKNAQIVFNCRTTMKPQNSQKLNDPGITANLVNYTALEGRRVMHVPGLTPLLVMKTGLCLTFQRARARLGPEIGTGYPECFFLPEQKDRMRDWAAANPDRYIIQKFAMDAGGSSQFLFKVSDFIKSDRFTSLTEDTVVQTYVEKPFQKAGFKTDIRLFGAVLFDPPRVYLSRFGVYKTANSTPDFYRLDETTTSNRFMHISNAQLSDPSPEQVPENEFVEGDHFIWGTLRQWFRYMRRQADPAHCPDKSPACATTGKKLDPDEVWMNIMDAAIKPALAVQPIVSCRGPSSPADAAWARDKLSLKPEPIWTTTPQRHTCGAVWQDIYFDIVVDDDGQATVMEIHLSDGNFKAKKLMFGNRLLAQQYNIAGITGFGMGLADLLNPVVHQFCEKHIDRASTQQGILPHPCDPAAEFGLPECLGTYERDTLVRLGSEYHYAVQHEMDGMLPIRWHLYRHLMRPNSSSTAISWSETMYHLLEKSKLLDALVLRGINPLMSESLFPEV